MLKANRNTSNVIKPHLNFTHKIFPVKLLSHLIRKYYFIDKTSSRKQLQDDFGEFPPAPLICENLRGDFEVVRINGIGELYYEFKVRRELLQAMASDRQILSREFLTVFGSEELSKIRNTIKNGSGGSIILEKLFMFLMLSGMIFREAVRLIKSGRRRRVVGVFVPIFANSSHIVVKSGRHIQKSDASTVSHEHLHLLQYRNPESHCRNARSPETFLCERMAEDRFLLYILEKVEVEARLHEVVLSFYRAHGQLPLTVAGFLGMLAAADKYGELLSLILKRSNIRFECYSNYSIRDIEWAEQLESIWIYIELNEIACKFITEVLAVMYGNLLRYYGDNEACNIYLKEIVRPNFYDALYGKISS